MRGRIAPLLLVLAVAATGCARANIVVEPGEIGESTFVTQVADFEGDVGKGLSLATDAEGNPHLAYLAFEDPEQPGATPATPVPGAPQLPAVKHAHLIGGAWTRSVVAEDQQGLEDTDATGIAVDAQGTHHAVWTLGGDLLYSNNAEQTFSEPQTVAGDVFVASLAVTDDGVPSAAFFGPGGVQVTSTEGEQTISAEARLEPGSLSAATTGDTLLVAFADGAGIQLARPADGTWSSEVADPDGAFGVSLDLDAEGNPHVAYYTAFGEQGGEVRHAHSIDGAPWEISTVADVAGPPPEGGRTSIAVAEDGTHHVAWQTADGVGYATNAGGEFAEEDVPGASGGTGARVATGPEGVVYLAFYDPEDTEVQLAVRGGGEPLLAVPQPGPTTTAAPTEQPTEPPACEPAGTELAIVAQGIAFDTDCLAAPAGQAFTIQFDNQDQALPHNVAIYSSGPPPSDPLFQGEIFPGPDSRTYEVDALDAGQLYFQCDVHPNMNGTFVVA
ncbi:MAG TPA: cupredoxin domain-containing protein [Actinomycetota bacterium]|nr:cupredoxin domain-containing protein [Actinomycetota bacterium]